MIILICPESKEIRIEDLYKHHTENGIVKCDSFEEATALLAKNCYLDPVVTFAPTLEIVDTIISNHQSADRSALVVIYDEIGGREVSTQSYLVEACRKLIKAGKDETN